MQILLQSSQNYQTHTEAIEERIEALVSRDTGETKIIWPEGKIIIEENRIYQTRNSNQMLIEVGKTHYSIYQTGHSNMKIATTGISIHRPQEGSLLAEAAYNIQIENLEPYKNELKIMIVEKGRSLAARKSK